MRILHLTSWFQPILGYSEYHLAAAQKRLNQAVAVATSDRYFPFPDYDFTIRPLLGPRIVGSNEGEEHGLITHRLPVMFEFKHHLWLRNFDSVLAKFQPDIVHVHEAFTPPVFQAAMARSAHKYGLVISSSMEKSVFYPKTFPRWFFYKFHKALIAPTVRRNADAFTAVGAGARNILAVAFGLPPNKIELIPLGADSGTFVFDPEAREQIRKQLDISNETILAIYAGKIIPDKDVHVLVAATARINPEIPLALLLLGNGTNEYINLLHEICRHARRLLFIRPAVPNAELNRYFSAADIGVWPSQSSNAAIEAALVGLPLIVSDSEATSHYIEAQNGLTFPRGDEERLASCLERLALLPNLRREMAQRGRAHVLDCMSWEAIAKRCLKLYERILSSVA